MRTRSGWRGAPRPCWTTTLAGGRFGLPRRLSPAIARLCRSVEEVFRREGSSELFLTPRRSQAFDIHFDLHDVFLLQLDGAKTWHIYEPIIEHPAPVNVVGKRHCGDRVGEPMAIFEVRKGDLLYIPHGFPHQGITSDQVSPTL